MHTRCNLLPQRVENYINRQYIKLPLGCWNATQTYECKRSSIQHAVTISTRKISCVLRLDRLKYDWVFSHRMTSSIVSPLTWSRYHLTSLQSTSWFISPASYFFSLSFFRSNTYVNLWKILGFTGSKTAVGWWGTEGREGGAGGAKRRRVEGCVSSRGESALPVERGLGQCP